MFPSHDLEGQVLLGPDGKNKTVRNTNRLLQRKNVYNLTVNNGHTYISNGVYSHNKEPTCNACNQSDCLWFCNTSTRVWEIVPGEDCPADTDADGRSCSCYNPCPDSVCADIADNCPDICSSPDPALNAQCVTAGLCIRACDDTRPVNCGAGCSDGATPIPYASTDGGDKQYYGGGTTNAIYAAESGTGNYAPVRGQRIANITGEIVIDMSGSNYWSIAYSPTPTTYTGSYDCFTGTCTGGFITSCIGTYEDGCPPDGTGLNARFYPKVINDRCLRLPSGTQVQLQNDGGGLDLYFVTSYKKPVCDAVTSDTNLYFYDFVPVDATSSNVVLTLPVSTGACIDGDCYTIKKIDSSSNTVIITGLSNDTIDGQLTYTMYNQNEAIRVCNCGDDTWYVI